MQISLIAALTADGFIGHNKKNRSFDWTSVEDQSFYVQKIKEADALVMGRQTFETFSRYPKGSHWVIYTSRPETFKAPQSEIMTIETATLPPRELLKKLEAEGRKKIMICGGTSIYTMFMQAGLVNKLYLTVEPVLFGSGVKLFGVDLGQVDLKLLKIHQLSKQVVVLEYKVKTK